MITTRTTLSVCAALAAVLAAAPALATGTTCKGDPHKCNPQPTNPPPSPASSTSTSQAGSASTSTSTSSALAGAQAGSQASGVGNASVGDVSASLGPVSSSTGPVSTSVGPVSGGSASANGSQSQIDSSRSYFYTFPAPVSAAPLPATNCPKGDSLSWSIGWNFFSYSSSSTRTELECLEAWAKVLHAAVPQRAEVRLPPPAHGESIWPPVSVNVTVTQPHGAPKAKAATSARKATPARKAPCPAGERLQCKKA